MRVGEGCQGGQRENRAGWGGVESESRTTLLSRSTTWTMARTSRRHSGHTRRPVPRSHTRLAHPAARKPSTVTVARFSTPGPIVRAFVSKSKFRTPEYPIAWVDLSVYESNYEGWSASDALLRISAHVEIQGRLSVRTDRPVSRNGARTGARHEWKTANILILTYSSIRGRQRRASETSRA